MSANDNGVIIKEVEEAIRAIPDGICDYEFPGYFAIVWKDRIYALGTANGQWDCDAADNTDEMDTWEPFDEFPMMPLGTTTQEIIDLIKLHILSK